MQKKGKNCNPHYSGIFIKIILSDNHTTMPSDDIIITIDYRLLSLIGRAGCNMTNLHFLVLKAYGKYFVFDDLL